MNLPRHIALIKLRFLVFIHSSNLSHREETELFVPSMRRPRVWSTLRCFDLRRVPRLLQAERATEFGVCMPWAEWLYRRRKQTESMPGLPSEQMFWSRDEKRRYELAYVYMLSYFSYPYLSFICISIFHIHIYLSYPYTRQDFFIRISLT